MSSQGGFCATPGRKIGSEKLGELLDEVNSRPPPIVNNDDEDFVLIDMVQAKKVMKGMDREQ